MIKYALLLGALLVCYGCGDEDKDELGYDDIGAVTGLDFFDANGQAIGRWKTPNHKTLDVAVFPIPAADVISLSSFDQALKAVWIVPAECVVDATSDITVLSQSLSYSITEIASSSTRDIQDIGSSNASISLENLSAGFYRLFYENAAGTIGWTNIYVDTAQTTFPDFSFFDDACSE